MTVEEWAKQQQNSAEAAGAPAAAGVRGCYPPAPPAEQFRVYSDDAGDVGRWRVEMLAIG